MSDWQPGWHETVNKKRQICLCKFCFFLEIFSWNLSFCKIKFLWKSKVIQLALAMLSCILQSKIRETSSVWFFFSFPFFCFVLNFTALSLSQNICLYFLGKYRDFYQFVKEMKLKLLVLNYINGMEYKCLKGKCFWRKLDIKVEIFLECDILKKKGFSEVNWMRPSILYYISLIL